MSGARGRGGRRRGHGGAGHEDGERWLLTYADMITLLMALFMVLFSISSVNISKYEVLQKSLQAAFSGDPLPGGKSIAQPGASANSSRAPTAADVEAVVPVTQTLASSQSGPAQASASASTSAAAAQEQSELVRLQHQIQAYATSHGFGKDVSSSVQARGLVIRVLTDRLLFASGSATLIPQGYPLLGEIATLVNLDQKHQVAVEGNTDNVPIQGGAFPSNWELSTARASTVVRFLIGRNVFPSRLSASGYADLRPIASNATARGRAENRRVEIVLRRRYGSSTAPSEGAEGP